MWKVEKNDLVGVVGTGAAGDGAMETVGMGVVVESGDMGMVKAEDLLMLMEIDDMVVLQMEEH